MEMKGHFMRKKATTAAIAASLVGGIAIGSFVAPPMSAFAADTSTSASADATARTPGQWITNSLKSLVDKGTITQQQSDTIATTLKDAEPKGGHGRGGPGGRMNLAEAAKVLGVSESDLRTATQTKSLADVAKDKNVDVQKVIDALVTAQKADIDKRVTDGSLTQAEADQRKADVTQRVTDMVNQVRPTPPQHNGDAPAPNGAPTTSEAPAA
jgi:hypothetical protein